MMGRTTISSAPSMLEDRIESDCEVVARKRLGGPQKAPASTRQRPGKNAATTSAGEYEIDTGPLRQYLGYYMRRLYDIYGKQFVVQSGDLDVHPREVGALILIGLNPGMTPKRLGAALAMDGAQITGLLNMFVSRNVLERRISEEDGRSRQVFLTAQGKKSFAHVMTYADDFDTGFSSGILDDAERKQLVTLLGKLFEGLDNV